MSVDINNCDNIRCSSSLCIFGLEKHNLLTFVETFLHTFFLVSLMESLDSTLETKRPAAALNLLSQQNKPQVGVSSEGQ